MSLFIKTLFSQDINLSNLIKFSSINQVQNESFDTNSKIYLGDVLYIVQNVVPNNLTVDTLTVIPTANSKFAVIADYEIELSAIGGIYGDLNSLDYIEARETRIKNRKILKKLTQYCTNTNKTLKILSRYEIWHDEDFIDGDNNALINCSTNKSLFISGSGASNSKIKVYPKINTNFFNDFDLINASGENMSISVRDISIEGRDFFLQEYETYKVSVNSTTPSGNIHIPDSIAVRDGFWLDLQIGDTLALEQERDVVFNRSCFVFTVLNFNSTLRTINIDQIIKGSSFLGVVENNYSSQGGTFIGRPWKEIRYKDIPNDTIVLYSGKWRQADNREDAVNINYTGDEHNSSFFSNCYFSNYYSLFSGSGDRGTFEFDKCKLFNSSIALQVSTGINAELSELILKVFNSEVYDHGYDVEGGFISGNRGVSKGSGLYTSPNLVHDFYNTVFWNCEKYASRQYSASLGQSKASNSRLFSKFVNCTFDGTKGTRGAALMTSASMPTVIENCVFDSTLLTYQQSLIIKGCKFINSSVSVNGLNSPFSIYGSNKKTYPISIKNCFFENSGVSMGQGFGWERLIDFYISDCSFIQTDDGIGGITVSNTSSIIENIEFIIKGADVLVPNGDLPVKYLIQTSTDYVNASDFGSNFLRNKGGYNLVIRDVNIEYPSLSRDSLYNFGVYLISPNIGAYNYKTLVENTRSQSSILFGSNVKEKYKFNVEYNDCIIYNLGYSTPMRIKNFTRGYLQDSIINYKCLHWPIENDGVYLKGDTLKQLVLFTEDFKYTLSNPTYEFFDGIFKINPSNDIVLIPYTQDTLSNIYSEDTVILKSGIEYEFKHVLKGEGYLSNYQVRDTVITLVLGDGNSFEWNSFDSLLTNPPLLNGWVLESGILTTSDGVSATINSDGQIISNDNIVQGAFSNYNDNYFIQFKNPPANGSTINLSFKYYLNYHWDNFWILKTKQ